MINPDLISGYLASLRRVSESHMAGAVEILLKEIEQIRESNSRVFLCGNGGSGANALHIENDLSIGIHKSTNLEVSVETLGSNIAVASAISNDYSYDVVFSKQLLLKARKGDLLIVFSGSGNSKNIVNVLKTAQEMEVRTCGIFGFDAGICSSLVDALIHFPVNDMQIAEDLQIILGHLVLKHYQARESK